MYTKTKLNLIFNRHCSWTRHCEMDVFGNWPGFFLNWPNFLDVLAGNFFGTWQHWACTTHRDRHTSCRACQKTWSVQCRPAGTARRAGSYWSPVPLLRLEEEKEVMSVRYTATWYDVTQARQQEHTPYTQTRTGPAGRSPGQCTQCCQVAEIPAKKLKRGRRKFSKKFLIFSCDNHV